MSNLDDYYYEEDPFKVIRLGKDEWYTWRITPNRKWPKYFKDTDFSGLDLSRYSLQNISFQKCKFLKTNLSYAGLENSEFDESDLTDANLFASRLENANFRKYQYGGSNCLRRANLHAADLSGADLYGADLTEANLTRANLTGARLVEVNLEKAILQDCHVYGISAWNINLEDTIQSNLIISKKDEPSVTVDNLEVAQFIYLLLNNKKIRGVIDTITSKAVLILGRFTEERKRVLDAIRYTLRDKGYVPILFDFQPSAERDLTETVQLLANMAKFIIADLTDAKSIPQELSAIVPYLPSVPVQPILLSTQREYAMFEHWERFPWVLDEFLYDNEQHLIENLEQKIIAPVSTWKGEKDDKGLLREEVKKQEQRINELEKQLKAQKNLAKKTG